MIRHRGAEVHKDLREAAAGGAKHSRDLSPGSASLRDLDDVADVDGDHQSPADVKAEMRPWLGAAPLTEPGHRRPVPMPPSWPHRLEISREGGGIARIEPEIRHRRMPPVDALGQDIGEVVDGEGADQRTERGCHGHRALAPRTDRVASGADRAGDGLAARRGILCRDGRYKDRERRGRSEETAAVHQ